MRILTLFILFVIAYPVSAQTGSEPTEWDALRFTESDYEVSGGLREVQQLLRGRESLLQSYERTDQSMIYTERAIEGLARDRIATRKAELDYYEAQVNFKYPEFPYDDVDEDTLDRMSEEEEIQLWLSQIETHLKSYQPTEPIPPRIHIRSLSETTDGVSIELDNTGGPVDALISVADSKSTIIGQPYQLELRNWDDPRHIHFKLLSPTDRLNLLVDTGRRAYKIPLFIRQRVAAPRIVAFPLEQSTRIGESVEYTVIIEGDPTDQSKHAISISNLPKGIAWEIRKVLPATMPDSQPRSVSIRNVQFTSAFNRHELGLLLTISRTLPRRWVGKPISFTLKVGATRESLSITPLGVGEITLDVPAAVQVRLGEEKEIGIALQNSGTETVNGITVRSVGTTYGVTLRATEEMTITPGEQRELSITLSVAEDAPVGPHDIQLTISSSAASQTATLHLEIRSQAGGMARLAGLKTPALICLAVVMVGYSGMKFQKFRQQRAQDSAQDYDL